MNDLIPQQTQEFSRAVASPAANVGAIAIESERAIAEVQGQMTLAKRFPRSMVAAQMDVLDACKSPDFAAIAFYAVPNRGSGPSIRFAEEIARCYGNFSYGHRELSRTETGINGPGKSEIEVYAWDQEKNNRSTRQITVMHVTDTKNGAKVLRDQADIDNKIANVASKQMRGRILALVPKALVAAGIAECKRTLAGTGDKPLSDRILGMSKAFAAFGVNGEMLKKHLGHSVDNTTIDELADLMGIYNAIRDGGKASEFFPADGVEEVDPAVKAITAAAAKPAAAAPAATRRSGQSKPAESASKKAEDAAPVVAEKAAPPAEKEAVAAPEQAEAPVADDIDAGNKAAAPAAAPAVEGDVF